MIKAIIILSAIITTISSCASNSGKLVSRKADTDTVIIHFFRPDLREFVDDISIRLSKDSVTYEEKGGAIEKVVIRDTIYYIPILDTVRGVDNRPLLDSLKKPKMKLNYYKIPNKFILLDYNKRFK